MIHVYMLIGIPGCGKTSFFHKLKEGISGPIEYVNLDTYRVKLLEDVKHDADFDFQRWRKKTDKKVKKIARQKIGEAIRARKVIVLDNMNLKSHIRQSDIAQMRKFAREEVGEELFVTALYFDFDIVKCVDRVCSRSKDSVNYVSMEIVRACKNQLDPVVESEGFNEFLIVNRDWENRPEGGVQMQALPSLSPQESCLRDRIRTLESQVEIQDKQIKRLSGHLQSLERKQRKKEDENLVEVANNIPSGE